MTKHTRIRALLLAALLTGSVAAWAQIRIPKAELTPVVETVPVRAGGTAIVRLEVELSETLHVQSDEPRDEFLIPTVLTLNAPEGITVESITYPPAEDLNQAGSDEPLAVFPHAFTIEARLSVAPNVAPGEVAVPGRLRYQACDETVCYPPARADTSWMLTIREP